MLKADLHVHTCYSQDCCSPLDRIISRCLKLGINCIAVADHGTIAGALKLKNLAPFQVIVGQEILTPIGELMGLFLTERVPQGLPAKETISRIKGQGGLVGIPHPFGRWPWENFNKRTANEILAQVDVIEVFNSRTLFSHSCVKARKVALAYSLAASAGSDAHTIGEIGKAYVEMPEFDGPSGFLNSLAQGKILGGRSIPLVHFASTWAKIKKKG